MQSAKARRMEGKRTITFEQSNAIDDDNEFGIVYKLTKNYKSDSDGNFLWKQTNFVAF